MKNLLALFSLGNIKIYLIVAGIGAAIWFFKDYQFQKSENERQTGNIENLRKMDSLRFASQTYTKKELDEYLEYQRKDLQQFLEDNKIKTSRIEQIISQKLDYTDNELRRHDLQPVLEGIKNEGYAKVPFTDSTDCLVIKGFVIFENDTLSLDITDRKFTNTSDVISYWERNQWSFLGIKTRLFGKKQATVIIKDACGRSETFVIDKRK